MILCIEQNHRSHPVYEIEEPAWGGIGALTAVDRHYAHAYARKLVDEGELETGKYRIALYGERADPLDSAILELAHAPAGRLASAI